jgi:hypothetical protein
MSEVTSHIKEEVLLNEKIKYLTRFGFGKQIEKI